MKGKQEYGWPLPELRRYAARKLTSIADSISFHRWSGPLKKKACRTDWSYLPPELLPIIARKLTNIPDYIHFRSVCTSWRRAAGPSDLQPQQPLLLLQHKPPNGDFYSLEASFHVSQLGCSHLCPQKPQANLIYGTSQGWVLKLACTAYGSDSSLLSASLLNPVNGAQILLPILPKHIHFLLSKCHFVKVVICPRPASPRPRQFLVALMTFGGIHFCRHGDETWTKVECGWFRGDIVYYDNELYLAGNCGRMGVLQVELAKIRRLTELKPPGDHWPSTTIGLLEAAGDLLLIKWFSEDFDMNKRKLAVFRLDRGSNGELNWVSIGETSVSIYPALSICARKIPNSGGYEIYFAYPDDEFSLSTARRIHTCFHVIPGVGILELHRNQLPKRYPSGTTEVTWMVPSLE